MHKVGGRLHINFKINFTNIRRHDLESSSPKLEVQGKGEALVVKVGRELNLGNFSKSRVFANVSK